MQKEKHVPKSIIRQEDLVEYDEYLRTEERSVGTRRKYCRDIRLFVDYLGSDPLTKEQVLAWREHLLRENYAPVTINSMIAALNGFFRYLGREDCRLRFLKIQRRLFRDSSRELTRGEYELLVETAYRRGKDRLALLIETIGASGIRVSEVPYITVEAARAGRTEVSLKGKIRCILLPRKLCRKLLQYAKKQKITAGEIFLTGSGKGLSRGQIWSEMKGLCKEAGVEPTKVFPHNLRHLFAMVFYKTCKDISKLADILGHSSIETTRIYLLTTGREHEKQLERLCLIL